MTLDDIKKLNSSMHALIMKALKEKVEIEFETSRRAENFRRAFYKFRTRIQAKLEEEAREDLYSINTTVQGKTLIFSTEQQSHAPNELIEALGLNK